MRRAAPHGVSLMRCPGRGRREVLWRLWHPAPDRGACARRCNADARARNRLAGGRAPAADRALLRPRRLDAALPATRRRGLARHRRAVPAGRMRRGRAVGGHVAKNLGDGLLVYFGWPDAREDDPERAMRAGLAILDAMEPVNA